MMSDAWQVEVLAGPSPAEDTNPPLKFGVPQVQLTSTGSLSDATVPLIYGPVGLRSVDGELFLESHQAGLVDSDGGGVLTVPNTVHRSMDVVFRVEFTYWGYLDIWGIETRVDGVAVSSCWRAERYQSPPPPDCAACDHPLQWHTRFAGDDKFTQDGKGECISEMDGGCSCVHYASADAS